MTDATVDLKTISWGDPSAPITALVVHEPSHLRGPLGRALERYFANEGRPADGGWRHHADLLSSAGSDP